ncbi:hypothetical protein RchiOBHm_Chr7g0186661 [Rosa chinensis]|uniref:Uncharacterized protein n=1 Tax=Rosa chinensis TaxID=74649 RepID=A0A2P6P408_ROSCH|nr:hypothetical protein RchiOBHm_Chr7g0186661 [Rosa chinensis]
MSNLQDFWTHCQTLQIQAAVTNLLSTQVCFHCCSTKFLFFHATYFSWLKYTYGVIASRFIHHGFLLFSTIIHMFQLDDSILPSS